MKFVKVSSPTKPLDVPVEDAIHLFTQFFTHKDAQRRKEIKFCLNQNSMNPRITKIHLLNEKIYTTAELGVSSPKIVQSNIGTRLTYKNIAKYIRENRLTGYFVMANSDIFFTDELKNLFVSELSTKKQLYALLRYEYDDTQHVSKSKLFGPRAESNDTWIYHSNFPLTDQHEKILNIQFGKPGCDNKIAYIYTILGYDVINDPLFIKSYHYHRQQTRDYGFKDKIPEPYLFVSPAGIPMDKIIPSLGIDFNAIRVPTRNYTRMCMDDNAVIYDYIKRKVDAGENFIIPRISGIENNVAVLTKQYFVEKNANPEILSYLKRVMPVMKKNAGIKISGADSLVEYSEKYLEAFELCELFGGWEHWGDVMRGISFSYPYMMRKYGYKDFFLSYAVDVFTSVQFPNVWTTAMRGKRILVISAFAESIAEKIPIREKIYGVDLFPECTITTIRPPQTHASNDAREFSVELAEFFAELDKVKDTYDVALVSAGGYANLICAHIFKSGNSAMYVGGVLQMLFGVLGARWLKETPDAVRLYLNEHWSRPKESERPRDYKNIENGCYF
jgi:hypothetical protein